MRWITYKIKLTDKIGSNEQDAKIRTRSRKSISLKRRRATMEAVACLPSSRFNLLFTSLLWRLWRRTFFLAWFWPNRYKMVFFFSGIFLPNYYIWNYFSHLVAQYYRWENVYTMRCFCTICLARVFVGVKRTTVRHCAWLKPPPPMQKLQMRFS